ncbi:MAG: hemolysin III family protein, partial [Bacteroidaceae bacterium]|nr:hemolysin III family protein [Bacteroidaceae bacterium]
MWGISERGNTCTHLAGVVFALSSIWMVWPAVAKSWEMAFGVIFFIVGMFLMYLSSSLYHWVKPGMAKDVLRRLDHISIYVMIACSYTPICVGVVGGWVGWTLFGVLWAIVLAGTFYKIFAFGKYPKLSLAICLSNGAFVSIGSDSFQYNLTHQRTSAVFANGQTSSASWNCTGPTSEVSVDGVTTTYQYDGLKRCIGKVTSSP